MELKFTKHPVLVPPTDEEIVFLAENDPKILEELHKAHEGRIESAQQDPLRHGFELNGWSRMRDALSDYNEVLTLGGNRSGKTTGCAKMVMEAVTQNENGHIVCFSQNADTSIKIQQSAIWEMMPREFKRKTKSIEGYINFSMQNGFTGSSFIFPDTRTRVDFKTYTQFSNNQTILEGFEFGFKDAQGLNIGAWLDEYLGTAELVNTLRFRLATRNAKMVLGFTPIDGFTAFISEYLTDAQTLETRKAELLKDEEVPVRQYSNKRDAGVVYLHSDENPFGGYDRIAKDLKNEGRETILVRAYGVPVHSMTTVLPMFSTSVNVLSDEEFPDITNKSEYTIYQVVDPADARNYVSIWAAVNEMGDIFIRREFPDLDTYGNWAVFGDPKWKYGPAAKKLGYNTQGYIDEFKDIEKDLGIEVFERIGDSRFFARENSNAMDLFQEFSERGMDFVPSDGRQEHIGIAALDEWFYYNPNVEIDATNRPKCYVHESCGNLIQSIINYSKTNDALKDFFDLMRYLRLANSGDGPVHYGEEAFVQYRGTGGY